VDIVLSYCSENIILQRSFGFIEALDLKRKLNILLKGIKSAMECTDVAAFTFAT